MSLLETAHKYSCNPSDIDAMTAFMDALGQERSIDEIKKILPIDFERIAGPALSRLTDILPADIDLLLSIALWEYHFGLDEEARQHLDRAKSLAPSDLRVLQVEIFLNYGSDPDYILSLCETALALFPHDEWILAIKRKIERTGQIRELNGPPLNLSWQRLVLAG